MKTTVLAIFLVLSSITASKASNHIDSVGLKDQLEEVIELPKFAPKKEFAETVYVSFEVVKNGKLKVLEMNVSNEKFGNYVKTQLEKIEIEAGDDKIGRVYNYKFSFARR